MRRAGAAMLGPPKTRDLDRPVLASLEALVPANHFYRQLDAKLDLAFVRELVADRYAAGGRPSIDPVVFFRLQLIMFFEGLRSERKLMETVALNLAHRWYLGYHLDEPLPDRAGRRAAAARRGSCAGCTNAPAIFRAPARITRPCSGVHWRHARRRSRVGGHGPE
jgi:hypothetical protein